MESEKRNVSDRGDEIFGIIEKNMYSYISVLEHELYFKPGAVFDRIRFTSEEAMAKVYGAICFIFGVHMVDSVRGKKLWDNFYSMLASKQAIATNANAYAFLSDDGTLHGLYFDIYPLDSSMKRAIYAIMTPHQTACLRVGIGERVLNGAIIFHSELSNLRSETPWSSHT